jgi:hypothetical protein
MSPSGLKHLLRRRPHHLHAGALRRSKEQRLVGHQHEERLETHLRFRLVTRPTRGHSAEKQPRAQRGHGARVVHPPTASLGAVAKRSLLASFLELSPESTSSQEPMHQWPRVGAVQSAVTGPGSQTQYLSACGVIPGTSFRSPEGNANAICDPPVCTANWHTCPAGAAHRKVTVCCASVLLGVCRRRQTEWRRDAKRRGQKQISHEVPLTSRSSSLRRGPP